jgi:hypothetical protein
MPAGDDAGTHEKAALGGSGRGSNLHTGSYEHMASIRVASMYLACEALSEGMQRLLGSLHAVNVAGKAITLKTREAMHSKRGTAAEPEAISAVHPVVRTHPETGRKALYVNLAHTLRFTDMSEEESAPLLDYLFAHQIRPEFTCRFRWRPGSLAFWDNRASLHYPLNELSRRPPGDAPGDAPRRPPGVKLAAAARPEGSTAPRKAASATTRTARPGRPVLP